MDTKKLIRKGAVLGFVFFLAAAIYAAVSFADDGNNPPRAIHKRNMAERTEWVKTRDGFNAAMTKGQGQADALKLPDIKKNRHPCFVDV